MPWVKLSDDWYDDPDLIEAGPLSMLVWPLLISWSARNLTDGRIPASQVRRLVDWSQLDAEPEQAIAPLVANGRLQEIAGGYLITRYLDYQPSRAKVLSDREKDNARKASARNPHGIRASSDQRPDVPVPVPVPGTPVSSSSDLQPPDDLWKKIAEKQAAASTTPISNRQAWIRKAAANARTEHADRAAWLWSTYDMTESQLVDVILAGGSSPLLNSLRKRVA